MAVSMFALFLAIMTNTVPKTMKAIQAQDYGPIDDMLALQPDVNAPDATALTNETMLVQVLAVALAPGDARILSGRSKEVQGPHTLPYIPGGDCCGRVMALPDDHDTDLPFVVGDRVAVRFDRYPLGCLAEYAIVNTVVADKVPESVGSDAAACLASASPAVLLADRINSGERVLVLGAGGGMGSHFCQLLRAKKAHVVGVSRNPERLLAAPIACNDAIDYTKTNPFTNAGFQKEPFDTIVDLGSGGWLQLLQAYKEGAPGIVKTAAQGGRFLTTTLDTAWYDVHSMWQGLQIFLFPLLWRAFYTRNAYRWSLPKFTFGMSLDRAREPVSRILDLAHTGQLQAVYQKHDFTTEAVRAAFHQVQDHHPHGKMVIHVTDDKH